MLRFVLGWVGAGALSGCLISDAVVDAVLDADGDGERSAVIGGPDCDDTNPLVNTRMPEICFDGIDNNCDGFIDDVGIGAQWWYRDGDGDGYGDPNQSVYACYAPDGYVDNDLDCDDGMRNVHPGAEEVCDGIDNNCDGVIDDADPVIWYRDADLDGWGLSDTEVEQCAKPPGTWVQQGGDCDDTNPHIHPGATEVWYDGVDQNCDGRDDFDRDGDGFRISAALFPDRILDPTYTGGSDCDDQDPDVHPDATEVWYDGVDQNCDGRDDFDRDGDGHRINATLFSHQILDPTYTGGDDCDDDDPTRSPSAVEVWYDGVDQDCDGADDFDQDGDGFRISAALFPHRILDPTYTGGSDCDDEDAATWPGAPEIWYDGKNQACNGADDFDRDGDGHRIDAALFPHLILDPSYSGGTDCDDNDAAVRPGMPEVWYDGVDQNCDGADDFDQDGDGARIDASRFAHLILDPTYGGGTDCDDLDPTIRPGVPEVWYDGVDQNCDGADDFDQDGDGHPIDASRFAHLILDPTYSGGTDCDDTDPLIHPDREEVWYNGIDENCDGADDFDQDGDGYRATTEHLPGVPPPGYFGDDCDDLDAAINPGAEEICGNGIRESCGEAWKTCSAYRPTTVDEISDFGNKEAIRDAHIDLAAGIIWLPIRVHRTTSVYGEPVVVVVGFMSVGEMGYTTYDAFSVHQSLGPVLPTTLAPRRYGFSHASMELMFSNVCELEVGQLARQPMIVRFQDVGVVEPRLRYYPVQTLFHGLGTLQDGNIGYQQSGAGFVLSGSHVYPLRLDRIQGCQRSHDGRQLLALDSLGSAHVSGLPHGKRMAARVVNVDELALHDDFENGPWSEQTFDRVYYTESSSSPATRLDTSGGLSSSFLAVRATGEATFRHFELDLTTSVSGDVDLDAVHHSFRSATSLRRNHASTGTEPRYIQFGGEFSAWSEDAAAGAALLDTSNADWRFPEWSGNYGVVVGAAPDEGGVAIVADLMDDGDPDVLSVTEVRSWSDLSEPRDLTQETPEITLRVENGFVVATPLDVDEDGVDDMVYVVVNADGAWVAISRGRPF